MEVVGLGLDFGLVWEGVNAMGVDGDDVVDVLQFSGDLQEGFLGDGEAEVFEDG